MVTVVLDPEVDDLLRQVSADLDVCPEEMASVILSSCLLMSRGR